MQKERESLYDNFEKFDDAFITAKLGPKSFLLKSRRSTMKKAAPQFEFGAMRKTVYKPKSKFEKPVVEEVSDTDSFSKRFYDEESN